MDLDRYSRQRLFSGIGDEGQRLLSLARVVVVGCGADGSVIADRLVRAGIGHITIIDRDRVELSNLQRQVLYDEGDVEASLPKATAAATKLQRINSQVEVLPLVQELRGDNAEHLLGNADLVLDGTDNFEARYVINDVCVKHEIPWVFCAVAGGYGMTMTIVPHRTPCLRCAFPEATLTADCLNCNTVGITNPIVSVVAGIASAEAIKLLVGTGELNPGMIHIDLWHNSFEVISSGAPRMDCPACGQGRFEFLTVT